MWFVRGRPGTKGLAISFVSTEEEEVDPPTRGDIMNVELGYNDEEEGEEDSYRVTNEDDVPLFAALVDQAGTKAKTPEQSWNKLQ